MRLYLEAHQLLIFPVAEHQGNERHTECALAAADADILMHLGQGRQRSAADGLIAPDVGLAHVDKLGIIDAHRVNAVGKMLAQRDVAVIDGQQRINPDLMGSQVDKLLRSGPQHGAQQQKEQKNSLPHLLL